MFLFSVSVLLLLGISCEIFLYCNDKGSWNLSENLKPKVTDISTIILLLRKQIFGHLNNR